MPLALITGGTAGIGRGFAEALAAEGYDLVLVARDESRLKAVAVELETTHGTSVEVLVADLADLDDTRRVEARLRSQPFDILVNNAGFGLERPFQDNDLDNEQSGLDVMVRAVMRLTHAALGPMLEAGKGDIVNVSSVAGFLPRGTYGAHKAWVTSFSSWGNVRYRKQGLRVMALCPGMVRTEFHERSRASVSNVPGWLWLDVDAVVREALTDLRSGKAVSVPSRRYRMLVALARITPRRIVERTVRRGR
jgi:short-subunit dehydrogenase